MLPETTAQPDNALRGRSAATVLGRTMTQSAVGVLFGLMEQEALRSFAGCAQQYLGMAIYKVFRHLTQADPEHLQGLFSLPEMAFLEAGNAAQQLSELQLKLLAARLAKDHALSEPLGYEAIRTRFTRDAPAFFNVLKRAEDQIRSI
ncbi:MAG: hypothetical protein IJF59_00385 [Clostridia bacterium]|nr:hypothetical protein [Clostridia bacterium]